MTEPHSSFANGMISLSKTDLDAFVADIPGDGTLKADLETDLGTLTVILEEERAPITVANFVGLALGKLPFKDPNTGEWTSRPYYDGLTFHRVIPDFMIQGGCPEGRGTGGPGYRFDDEFHADLRHHTGGILSMANSGPSTNGSQFFVTEVATPHLDNRHAIFGQTENVDLIQKIASVPKRPSFQGPSSVPATPVYLKKVRIYR